MNEINPQIKEIISILGQLPYLEVIHDGYIYFKYNGKIIAIMEEDFFSHVYYSAFPLIRTPISNIEVTDPEHIVDVACISVSEKAPLRHYYFFLELLKKQMHYVNRIAKRKIFTNLHNFSFREIYRALRMFFGSRKAIKMVEHKQFEIIKQIFRIALYYRRLFEDRFDTHDENARKAILFKIASQISGSVVFGKYNSKRHDVIDAFPLVVDPFADEGERLIKINIFPFEQAKVLNYYIGFGVTYSPHDEEIQRYIQH